jgi:DNA modification methylase
MLPIGLVKKFIRQAKGPVLDPFVGVGTVLVEAKCTGIEATGVDINPFMCFASTVKTRDYSGIDIKNSLNDVLNNMCKTAYTKPPSMFNLDKYYTHHVLKKLLVLKGNIRKVKDQRIKDLFMLCFLKVAISAANIGMSPAPRFVKNKKAPPIFSMFKKKIREIMEDLKSYRSGVNVDVYLGDSRNLDFLEGSYDLILTSPPYCNNVDYVRHTQLELYWLDYVNNSKDLGKIRKKSITSCEAMAYVNKNCQCHIDDVRKLAEKLGKRTDRALPRTITQYFADMQSHLESLKSLMKPTSRAVYVIGDSWMKGIYIPTHELLAKIAKSVGFSRIDLEFLRTRRSPRRHEFELSEYLLKISP